MTRYIPAELMFRQKPIISVERTITSWMAVDWADEMSQVELLVAWIRQLERPREDVEQATKRVKEARIKNKGCFDRVYQLRPRKVKEGNWVRVYDSSLDNQHRSTQKFVRRWLGPYVVMSANDNTTYHLPELEGTRIAVPVARKRIKVFKKQDEVQPDPELEGEDAGAEEPDENRLDDG